jgi:hypothetical protein
MKERFNSSSQTIHGASVYQFDYNADRSGDVTINTITSEMEIPMTDLLEFFHHITQERTTLSSTLYLYETMGAILGAMGIFIDVYAGEQPGEVIISICGLPPEVDREVIVRMLNRAELRPLTDIVTIKFNEPEKSKTNNSQD